MNSVSGICKSVQNKCKRRGVGKITYQERFLGRPFFRLKQKILRQQYNPMRH